jgi:hypothetical protein
MPVKQGRAGVKQEMHKFKEGTLHSGSKKGPIVSSRKQAIAISLHEAGLSRQKEETSKYTGSVSGYKHSRPTRKVVKRTFGNA